MDFTHDLVGGNDAGRPAVVCGTDAVTYGELDQRANRIAHLLLSRGVRRGAPVAVLMNRGIQMVAAMLGVLRCGGYYVPVDPRYPSVRQRHLLADSAVTVLLVDSPPEDVVAPVVVAFDQRTLADQPDTDPRVPLHRQDIAYMVYTSGSTGCPKGALIEHGGLRHLVDWWMAAGRLTADDRCAQLLSPGFDAAVLEIWPALAAGASLHLPSDSIRTDPTALVSWLNRERITVAILATPLAEAVLALPSAEPSFLRVIGCGGDRLRGKPRAEHRFELVNMYGLTEMTVVSVAGTVTAESVVPPPIGVAVDGTEALVMDDGLVVPHGVRGELYLAGPTVGRGYWNRPGLTAERFVPHPAKPGQRMYRTGDLVHRDADGTLHFHGRADAQLSVRGYRIEPGEVERAIVSHPWVRAAAVRTHDLPGGTALVGYVVPGADFDEAALRTHLEELLPAHMVPEVWVPLPDLPLTHHGKVDRDALPFPAVPVSAPPDGPVERVVAAAWWEVLGARPARTDNFFALGGHSLLATQVANRLRALLDLPVAANLLVQAQTVASVAELLVDLDGENLVRRAEIAELYLEMEALSPDEARQLLGGDVP